MPNKKMLISATAALKRKYIPMPHFTEIEEEFDAMVCDYFGRLEAGQPFEARGLAVIGASRSGKTAGLAQLLSAFEMEEYHLPSGQTAKMVRCTLHGQITSKELGRHTLAELGLPAHGSRATTAEIWSEVALQARRRDVVGIHYDEVQHIFSDRGGIANEKIADQFKSLLKDKRWPLMLVMSGVENLERHIDAPNVAAQQLRALISRVRIPRITTKEVDLRRLNEILYELADAVEIDPDRIASSDVLARLALAAGYRWGLAIELIVDALLHRIRVGSGVLELKDFVSVFSRRTGIVPGFSPFTAKVPEAHFDPDTLASISLD